MAVWEKLKGRNIKIIISESRPLYEGRTVAEKIAKLGLSVTLITDAQIGLFVENADMALVGADSILPNGDLVNKAGTYLLGWHVVIKKCLFIFAVKNLSSAQMTCLH